ncbi:MAG TPA: S8 family serine peptidase [Phototrophicaceae bacterium]|jgi:serine protease AprX|nr:S8 family serine peptidase [Phototrophicaceae bacterium]
MDSKSSFNPMPVFISNYPCYKRGEIALLSTPERTGALPDYTGKGVTIAFIDSGFYKHPDLKGRILLHVDATTDDIVEGDYIPKSQAFSWHGQMTTVIACGDGSKSNGRYRGIASAANLVLIKVSTPHNQIKEADILRGLRWVQKHHHRHNIKIVNLSVGGDFISYDSNHPLHRIVRDLTEDGLTIVAAAGNSGENHLVPPASAADAITVGGMDDNNTLDRREWSLYSHNYGMAFDGSLKPDILAPARWVASPILPGTRVAMEAFWLGPLLQSDDNHPVRRLIRQGNADQGLAKLFGDHVLDNLHDTLQQRVYAHKLVDACHQHVDGTSVAAPIVSSVIAQMLEANPALTPPQIRQCLRETAQPLPGFDLQRQGAGVVNAVSAVHAALNLR